MTTVTDRSMIALHDLSSGGYPEQEQQQPSLRSEDRCLDKQLQGLVDHAMIAAANTILTMQDQHSARYDPDIKSELQAASKPGASSARTSPAQHQYNLAAEHHQQEQAQGATMPPSSPPPKSMDNNNSVGLVTQSGQALTTPSKAHQAHQQKQQQQVELVIAAARELLARRQQNRNMQQLAITEQPKHKQLRQQLVPLQLRHMRDIKRTSSPMPDCSEPPAKRFQPSALAPSPEPQEQQQQHVSACHPTSASSTFHGAVCAEAVDNCYTAAPTAVHKDVTRAVLCTIMQANELLYIAVEWKLVSFDHWQPVASHLLSRLLALPYMTDLHQAVWLGTFGAQVKMYYAGRPAVLDPKWAAGLIKLLQVL